MSENSHGKKPSKNRSYLDSFRYAFEGVKTAFIEERNMRSHTISMLAVLLVSSFLGLTTFEWLWIILACFLVIIVEILNTVVENIVDLVSPNYHPIAKKIKDMAAAAVLFTAFFAVIVGLIILLPKIVKVF